MHGLNPGELQLELFCRGLRLDAACTLDDDGRPIARTRAGLGSGLELVIPGRPKDVWLNVPVAERFAQASPWVLQRHGDRYHVRHEPSGAQHAVSVPAEPAWYRRTTTAGVPMMRVGVLQGTYLGIYVGPPCTYWRGPEPQNCRFCTTGRNVGVNEAMRKSVDDVVETAHAAKAESGVTFVHLNSGFQDQEGMELVAPYVKALKERVGCLVGVQVIPTPEHWKYDWLRELGADHFSFCYEFHNPEYFAGLLPGKEATVGRETFFDALEYASALCGKGACSGEIIAGVEPVPDTLRAIDYITSVGAFPTVCIFRPVVDADMEDFPSPDPDDMRVVMRHMWESCRRARIPVGAAVGMPRIVRKSYPKNSNPAVSRTTRLVPNVKLPARLCASARARVSLTSRAPSLVRPITITLSAKHTARAESGSALSTADITYSAAKSEEEDPSIKPRRHTAGFVCPSG